MLTALEQLASKIWITLAQTVHTIYCSYTVHQPTSTYYQLQCPMCCLESLF